MKRWFSWQKLHPTFCPKPLCQLILMDIWFQMNFLGLFEILLLTAVYYFLHTLPLILLLILFLAFDFFVALFSAIYYCHKINAAARRRAKSLNVAAVSLPLHGHTFVPCNMVAQQIPLSCCYQSVNRNAHAVTSSLFSRCKFFLYHRNVF